MEAIEMGRVKHSYKVLQYLLILGEINRIQNYFKNQLRRTS